MFSFNPLFKNDFFGTDKGHHGGRHHAMGHHSAPGHLKQGAPIQPTVSTSTIEQTLAVAYEKLQVTVTSKIPGADSSTVPGTQSETDFSPQAVSDRILGFVTDRLAAEKANGASDEKLQDLYQQALSGIEKGLREAKDIIHTNGLFQGEVRDNFYSTVTKLADGLEALGEELFGQEIDPQPVAATSYKNSEVAFQRDRSFEMEVVTQDGDTIKLLVNSGQSGYASQYNLQAEDVQVDGFSVGFSSYDNLSFSVEGELDEGEISALKDLFQQVNGVAETFFGGNVEQAFDQAMSVGMDTSELAAFAVDIKQSQVVAVRDTYVAIDNMAGREGSGFSDAMPRLGAFANQTREAGEAVKSIDGGRINTQDLLRELISRFHSDAETNQGTGAAFREFVEALA